MIRMQQPKPIEPKPLAKVFIATPSHANMFHKEWVISFIKGQRELAEACVEVHLGIIGGDPCVDRVRNRLAHDFLKTSCTHLLFIDDDIEWRASDVLRMLEGDASIVGGACPSKVPNGQGTDQFVGVLASPLVWKPGTKFLNAERVGTGLMLVERAVFEAVKDKSPEFMLLNPETGELEKANAYFHADLLEDGQGNVQWFSEDYVFCEKWRALGGDIWLDTLCVIGHCGRQVYRTPTLHSVLCEP